MATPKPRPTLKGNDALREYQKEISPKGMAEAEAAAKRAIEKKYPGMFNTVPKIVRAPKMGGR